MMSGFTAEDAKKITEKAFLKERAEKEGEQKVIDGIEAKAKNAFNFASFSEGYESVEFEWLKDEAHQKSLKIRGFEIEFTKGTPKLFETDNYTIYWK